MNLKQLERELSEKATPEKAKIMQGFFKTGKGEYGEGDLFLGLTVPQQRELAKKYIDLPLEDVKKLLENKYHEFRLTGLFILVYKYEKNPDKKIIDFYLENKAYGNNWDLIDCVADKLLGKYLLDKDRGILYKLAKSDSLWDRRISIITTFAFIKNNEFDDTIKIAEILLGDKHDLIHKGVGWMLREIGKRDQNVLEKFLQKYYKTMPRTMLRYSIERFDEDKRRFYLGK
tara:strand:- start:2028 stop:2717 length:690 start_codon:yes stop_codon:yes gene_type:complete